MSAEKTLLVLAAGMGSRYGGLKQMDPVGPNGEFILDYSVAAALAAGFSRTVFVIRRDIETDFREIVGKNWENKTNVEYAFQEITDLPRCAAPAPNQRTKPWGTGHAVLAARKILNGPFAVVNADDYYGDDPFVQLSAFIDSTSAEPDLHAMAAYSLDKTLSEHGTVSRGVCSVDADGYLASIIERTALKRGADGLIRDGDSPEIFAPDSPTSMNLFAFKRSFIDLLEEQFPSFFATNSSNPKAEFFMPTELGKFVQAGRARVAVLRTNAEWAGVTCREDREELAARLRRMT